MFTPDDLADDKASHEVVSLLMVKDGGRERLIETNTGEMQHRALLPITHERPVTGALMDPDDGDTRQLTATARAGRDFSIRLANLPLELPPTVEVMDALDQVILASDRVVDDAAGCLAIRRWLHAGGRMWIMLDQVKPETVARLLGDDARLHVVDRVGLTEIEVKDIRKKGRVVDGPKSLREEPVDLVRVLGEGFDVTHEVNGWPAAFTQNVGKGKVLFTTLSPHGWMRPRTSEDKKAKTSMKQTGFIALPPLETLAIDFFQPYAPPTLDPEVFEPYVSEQIGYQVVDRRNVLLVLGGFCIVILAAGLWLMSAGRLQWLSWIGPAAAVVAATVLAAMGQASKTAVPPSIASGQFVEVSPAIDDLQATGLFAFYQQDRSERPIGAGRGGLFTLNTAGQSRSTRRMVWTDIDRWHWANLRLPSGDSAATSQRASAARPSIHAIATLGPQGIEGNLSAGTFTNLGDAVIATPAARRMVVAIDQQGRFSGGSDDVLTQSNFISNTVLTDEQLRRQAVYRQLFARSEENQTSLSVPYPLKPTLLFWADPLEAGFEVMDDVPKLGGALVAVPLKLRRPSVGAKIVIPSPLLPFQSVAPPDAHAAASTYNNAQRRWLDVFTTPTRTLMRFELPPELLPLRIDRAKLTLRINAPSRPLEITAIVDGKLKTLQSEQSPVGTFTFTIDDPDALQLDEGGGLQLGFNVGEFVGDKGDQGIATIGWKIDEATLEVDGEVVDE